MPDTDMTHKHLLHEVATLRQQLEQVIQERNNLRTLVNSIADEVWFCDADGCLAWANRAALQGLGFERVEEVVKMMPEWLTQIAIFTPAGHPRSHEDAPLLRALQGETLHDIEERVQHPQTGQMLSRQVSAAPLRDPAGVIIGSVAVVRDITLRTQAQKMEAIGTLAGGIAHEFNNILAIITMGVELAKINLLPESRTLQCLDDIQIASDRAKDLVQQILTFSRQDDVSRQQVNLSDLLKDIMRFVRQSLPSSIQIRLSIEDEDMMVWADATQMYQVMINACSNAEYAMRDQNGILTVRLEAVDTALPNTVPLPHAQPGAYVRLSIHDTGNGIAPDIQARIFDPFFTTKGVGEGTGMGLAIVHGIVSAHHGVITCDSAPGHGTMFSIYLPRDHEPNQTTLEPQEPLSNQNRCILFVDDEVLLTRNVERALTHLGYDIVAHTSSQEALAAFAADPQRFDLVVTDQTMPGMTGERLAQAMRQRRPDIPIILCTGFSHVIDAEMAQKQGINEFCLKPLNLQELCDTIERVLLACSMD